METFGNKFWPLAKKIAPFAAVGAVAFGAGRFSKPTEIKVVEVEKAPPAAKTDDLAQCKEYSRITRERIVKCESAMLNNVCLFQRAQDGGKIDPVTQKLADDLKDCRDSARIDDLRESNDQCDGFKIFAPGFKAVLNNKDTDCKTLLRVSELVKMQHGACLHALVFLNVPDQTVDLKDEKIAHIMAEIVEFKNGYGAFDFQPAPVKKCLKEQAERRADGGGKDLLIDIE